ncbi:MAG: PD-(D/E)XK nuclease family protein [bacterium]
MKIKKIPPDKFEKNYQKAIQWSNSKHKIYNECKRKFLYKYLLILTPPHQKQKVDELKKLTTLSNWQGELIHRYINILSVIKSIDKTIEMFTREYQNVLKNPSQKILEAYYVIPYTKYQIQQIYNTCILSLKNFWFYYQQNISNQSIICQDLHGTKTFNFEGITIMYRPDIVTQTQQEIKIYEFKTYKNTVDLNQILLYYLVFSSSYDKSVRSFVVNLYPTIEQSEIVIANHQIEQYTQLIKESYNQIKTFLDELRIFTQQENENLFELILEKFEKTRDKNLCTKCEFRELCFGKSNS